MMNWVQLQDEVRREKYLEPEEGKLSPSQLDIASICPGAINASKGLPNPFDEKAFQGSLRHKLAAMAFKNEDWPDGIPEDVYDHVNYVIVKVAMWETDGWEIVNIEEHFVTDLIDGTPDLVMKNGDQYRLIDFKFGEMPVSVYCNQLRGYNVILGKENTILNIIQPPLDYVGERVGNLAADIKLVTEIKEHWIDNRDLRTPTQAGCQFCAASATNNCPESLNNALAMKAFPVEIEKADEFMDRVLAAKKAIKKMEDQFKDWLKGGGVSEAWEIRGGYQRLDFNDPKAAFAILVEQDPKIADRFQDIVSLKSGAVGDLCAEMGLCEGGKEKEYMEAVLGDVITRKDISGKLLKKKI